MGDRIFNFWGPCEPVPNQKISPTKPFDRVNLGHTELQYIPATGHAPHQSILYDQKESIVFSADALGILDPKSNSILPTSSPPSFDFEKAIDDIRTIEKIKPSLACLAHFGEVVPDARYFESVVEHYESWKDTISSVTQKEGIGPCGSESSDEIFSLLLERYPEYSDLSDDLNEQARRIDISGIKEYLAKKRNQEAS